MFASPMEAEFGTRLMDRSTSPSLVRVTLNTFVAPSRTLNRQIRLARAWTLEATCILSFIGVTLTATPFNIVLPGTTVRIGIIDRPLNVRFSLCLKGEELRRPLRFAFGRRRITEKRITRLAIRSAEVKPLRITLKIHSPANGMRKIRWTPLQTCGNLATIWSHGKRRNNPTPTHRTFDRETVRSRRK